MRKLAICPNCKSEVNGYNILRERIDDGQKAKIDTLISMYVRTTMFSCPNCRAVLGLGQYTSY
ncbi:MAG: hypothetical protein NT131_01845 [Methanomassiliicoccales archaeon]|nr:hypothetical protein [Methanomassiliicoccales archaeon]